jgi:hypothetical protein
VGIKTIKADAAPYESSARSIEVGSREAPYLICIGSWAESGE